MKRIPGLLALSAPFCLAVSVATAQQPPAPEAVDLSLQDLMSVELVSAASKFPQEVREAPASITIVTAEEIHRQGHRTFADVLRSVRGFYTTYDRNYEYLGIRGFGRPGDYNTRVLILLDGHRLNDGTYDMAPIGTDFPIDISLVERIEIIRGPGSSLYGTNAFFAVINVITRSGATKKGLVVNTQGGSLSTRRATVSYGGLFAGEREVLIAGSTYESAGAGNLHFPEFDNGVAGSGVASNLDHDQASNVFGSFSAGRFSLHGGVAHRSKQIPTAAYGTIFGDERGETIDRRAYVSGVYRGPVAAGWSTTARLAYGYYGYDGVYPNDYGADVGTVLWNDNAANHGITGEFTATRRFLRSHLFTAGAEVRHFLVNRQTAEDTGMILDVNEPGTDAGLYVQDEVRLSSWLLVNVGVRLDRFPSFGYHATPRAALVILPRDRTAIKLLHGLAFRAPNAYERLYYDAIVGQEALGPERMVSSEVVWEERLSRYVRTSLSAFHYDAERIIEQLGLVNEDGDKHLYYTNHGDVRGVGVEGEVEAKLPRGLNARASHTWVRARNNVTGTQLSNSPRHLSKVVLQVPLASGFFLGMEGQYVGTRLAVTGEPVDDFFVPNATLTSPVGRRVEFGLSVYNVFDQSYGDPGGEEHAQRSIPQDGRTVLARFKIGF